MRFSLYFFVLEYVVEADSLFAFEVNFEYKLENEEESNEEYDNCCYDDCYEPECGELGRKKFNCASVFELCFECFRICIEFNIENSIFEVSGHIADLNFTGIFAWSRCIVVDDKVGVVIVDLCFFAVGIFVFNCEPATCNIAVYGNFVCVAELNFEGSGLLNHNVEIFSNVDVVCSVNEFSCCNSIAALAACCVARNGECFEKNVDSGFFSFVDGNAFAFCGDFENIFSTVCVYSSYCEEAVVDNCAVVDRIFLFCYGCELDVFYVNDIYGECDCIAIEVCCYDIFVVAFCGKRILYGSKCQNSS